MLNNFWELAQTESKSFEFPCLIKDIFTPGGVLQELNRFIGKVILSPNFSKKDARFYINKKPQHNNENLQIMIHETVNSCLLNQYNLRALLHKSAGKTGFSELSSNYMTA